MTRDVELLRSLVRELIDDPREHSTGCPGWYRSRGITLASGAPHPRADSSLPCNCGLDGLIARARAAVDEEVQP